MCLQGKHCHPSNFQSYAIFSAVLRIFTTLLFMTANRHYLDAMCICALCNVHACTDRKKWMECIRCKKRKHLLGSRVDTHPFWNIQSMMYNNWLNEVNLFEMICSLGNICTLFHVQFQVHCIAIISLGIDDNRYDTYTHSTHVYSRRIHIILIYTLIMRVYLGQSNLFRICFITIQLKETQHTNTHTHTCTNLIYWLTNRIH